MIIKENTKQKIGCAADVAKILQTILSAEHQTDQDKEHFWSIGLNTDNVIIYIELVSLGLLNQTQIHPRELFRLSIMRACQNIIIAHNHPSGNIKPSEGDFIITGRLKRAGEIMEIKILDHIIISQDKFYSFQDEGNF